MIKNAGDVNAIVLAGGLGTRLRPMVSDLPKALAEINGRPFIFYLLDQLVGAGFRRVIMCVGYRSKQISEALGAQYRNLDITYSREVFPLGTGGALRLVKAQQLSDPVLILNGDSYTDVSYCDFGAWHVNKGGIVSMVVTPSAEPSRYGTVELGPDGVVNSFVEKTAVTGDHPALINAGIYLVQRSFFDLLTEFESVKFSLERDVLPTVPAGGVYGFEAGGKFIDIGTPSSLKAASDFF
ncbi:MAG: galactokinase [Dehalococcoidia bacterium]|nr:galactokinase [Dehalococcoidia bacterium]|tara:strand:- start:16264 stop:16980 length:717 start_codon:yes stop_codon:yes gene_type:complete